MIRQLGSAVGLGVVTLVAILTLPAFGQVNQSPLEPVRYEGHKVVRVDMRNARDVRIMLALSDDPWSCGWDGVSPGRVSFRIPPEAMDALRAAGMKYTVLIDDVQAAIERERPPMILRDASWFADYKSYADVDAYLNSLVALRPDLASRVTVGNSLEGRALPGIRISSGAPGAKPGVIVIGCQHAREWITVMSTMFLADNLVAQYDTDLTAKRVVDNFEVFIIPIANPDGYVYTWASSNNRLWRKNRRNNGNGTFGVDLNRNWGYGWGGEGSSSSPGSDIYRGTAAFSEPCTTVVSNFIQAHTNTAFFFDIHSFSEFVLEPWGNTFALPPDTRAFHQLSTTVQSAIYGSQGTVYYAGETYRIIYPAAGGSHDWTYGVQNILGIALELRGNAGDPNGFVLPAVQIVPTATEWTAGFKAAMDWGLSNPVAISFPDGQPTTLLAGSSNTVRVQFNRGLKAIGTPAPGSITVSSRLGRTAPFTTVPVATAGTDESGTVYSHSLNTGVCGSVVQWYYTVPLPGGGSVNLPGGGASGPYEAVANSWSTLFSDDFETNKGWVVGDPSSPDTAVAGVWTRTDPFGYQANPEYDHTPLSGVSCFFTGQATTIGDQSNFVQGGKTTLRSPVFDLSAAPNAQISFWLWFFNDRQFPPLDPFRIDITNNATAGSPTWVQAINIAGTAPPDQTTGGWHKYTINVPQFVVPTGTVQIRLVASSTAADGSGNGNWIEAGIDDAAVVSYSCTKAACPGDYNGDGIASAQDLFDFLSAFFSGSLNADFNHSGAVTSQDLFNFLSTWFAGCP